jgi:hypothetical protein
MKKLLLVFFPIIILSSCGSSVPEELKEEIALLPDELDYNMDVKPILSDKCFACHSSDKKKQKAGLRLDLAEAAYGDLPENPGKVAIDPATSTIANWCVVFLRRIPKNHAYARISPFFE